MDKYDCETAARYLNRAVGYLKDGPPEEREFACLLAALYGAVLYNEGNVEEIFQRIREVKDQL